MEEPRRVLLVDDDVSMQMLVAMGCPEIELLEASRLSDALDLVEREKPDAVVVDQRLPDGEGIDLVIALRHDPALERIPAVIVTAGHEETRRSAFVKLGADEYLPKPIDPRELLARIDRLLALDPAARVQRRATILARLKAGLADDVDAPLAAPSADDSHRHRRFGHRD